MLIIINIVCDMKLIWFFGNGTFLPIFKHDSYFIKAECSRLNFGNHDLFSVALSFFFLFLPSNMKTILMNSRKSGANFGNELQNIDNNEMAELNINFSIIWSSSRPIELNLCLGQKKIGRNEQK